MKTTILEIVRSLIPFTSQKYIYCGEHFYIREIDHNDETPSQTNDNWQLYVLLFIGTYLVLTVSFVMIYKGIGLNPGLATVLGIFMSMGSSVALFAPLLKVRGNAI